MIKILIMDVVRVSIKLLSEALDLLGIENYVYGNILVIMSLNSVIQANEYGKFMMIYPFSCTIEDLDLVYVTLTELVKMIKDMENVNELCDLEEVE